MSVIRPKILRYITDHPGAVVYKDEIMDALGLQSTQVTAAVRGIQQESPIGSEIETVQHGNAWRYMPNRPITSPRTERAADVARPLTTILREYFVAHPYTVIHVDQLVRYSGRTESQVRVGVNNMRTGHADIRPYVIKLVDGQSYQYNPPNTFVSSTTVPTTSVQPTSRTPVATPIPVDHATGDGSTSTRLFEEVGQIDDDVLIRDSNGALYRATPLR